MTESAADKTHEPTQQKLLKAREKGDVARSTDLLVAASYAGLLLTTIALGPGMAGDVGSVLAAMLDRSESLSAQVLQGPAFRPVGGLLTSIATAVAPLFAGPAALVLAALLAQRALVFAPSKLAPKLSRISPVANARNKFGRSGLFEFAKSLVKLVLYSVCLGFFLRQRLPLILGTAGADPRAVSVVMADLSTRFLTLALAVAICLGGVDAVWQFFDLRRRNRMTRKELTDEAREAEGDPQMKQQRRFRAETIATSQMIAEVAKAEVVIVNPTHYAVALRWSRAPGSAPVCVAKGVDEMAMAIRRAAEAAGVPVQHDPATARAIHATVPLGQEIGTELYAPVAASIRFAEDMRRRVREGR